MTSPFNDLSHPSNIHFKLTLPSSFIWTFYFVEKTPQHRTRGYQLFMGSADSKMKGRLLLEDGCEFEGIHFGANVTVPGEVGNIAILFI